MAVVVVDKQTKKACCFLFVSQTPIQVSLPVDKNPEVDQGAVAVSKHNALELV